MAEPLEMTRLLIVTDLDGCLLDDNSQSYDAARPALAALVSARCPLVLCSAKSRAEMELIVRSIGLSEPFIVENGGALAHRRVRTPAGAGRMECGGADAAREGAPAQAAACSAARCSAMRGPTSHANSRFRAPSQIAMTAGCLSLRSAEIA
jgi:hypothetical protein